MGKGSQGVAMRQGRESWQMKAACRGPQSTIFFPPSRTERKDDRQARESRAKAICKQCAVQAECLELALQIREPYGIWGGFTEVERRATLGRRAG